MHIIAERKFFIDEDNAEDAEELKKVEEMDAVNEESKANLANALAGKMEAQKQQNMVLFFILLFSFQFEN